MCWTISWTPTTKCTLQRALTLPSGCRGPLVVQLHAAMVQLWDGVRLRQKLEPWHWSDAAAVWRQVRARFAPLPVPGAQASPEGAGSFAALVLRDNVRHRTSIERVYRKALGTAQRDVFIANAYFLPGRKLQRALVHAAQRGVRVRLLLQGRYEYFMQFHAARPLYGKLLAAGVEIHEYTHGFFACQGRRGRSPMGNSGFVQSRPAEPVVGA